MLIFIQLVKCLGNVERMVANALIIGQDFRIQDGSLHMAFPLSHASIWLERYRAVRLSMSCSSRQGLFQKGGVLR